MGLRSLPQGPKRHGICFLRQGGFSLDDAEAILSAFESDATDAAAVEICTELSQKNQISPLMGFKDLDTLINDMLGTLANGEQTPQTAVEANRSALEAAISDIQNHDYDTDMQEYLNPPEEEGEGDSE